MHQTDKQIDSIIV